MPFDTSNIYWIGGGSGAGKSTIAQRLATLYECELYQTDKFMSNHASRCIPEENPDFEAFKTMSMNERWVNRSPQTMLNTFHWFNGEGFNLIIEDLANNPKKCPIIVEGFRLLPNLVKPYLHTMNNGIWLIPTPEFRLAAFESRGTLWDIPNKTTQPEKALKNLLTRDKMFTNRVRDEAESNNCRIIDMNGSENENVIVSRVASHFMLDK